MANRLNLSKQQHALIWASAVSLVLSLFPIGRLVLLPTQYLNTFIHESMHALSAVFTGGSADHMMVFQNGEGVTPVRGGIMLIVASAGYVGATLLGAGMIAWSKTAESATWILRALLVSSIALALIWLRGDLVGVLAVAFWLAILGVAQGIKDANWKLFAVQFLGVQQCLNSWNSLRDLLLLTGNNHQQNDAGILARMTGIPAIVWAILWALLGLIAVATALRTAFRSK